MGRAKEVVYYNNRLKGKLLTDEDCNTLEKLMQIDKNKGYIEDLKNVIYELTPSDIELLKVSKNNAFVDLKKGELTNSQTIGVAYMYYAKNLVLGDSVGLGKTVEVCGLCNLLSSVYQKKGNDFRFLYLTNKTILSQAQEEFIKFTGEYVESVYGEAKYVKAFCKDNKDYIKSSVVGVHSLLVNEQFQEYLINYKRVNGCYPFDLLVVDEAGDVLTNSTTKTYKAAEQLRKMFDRIILLNATAFENNLIMFYNQLNFVDPTFLPTKTNFSKKYEIMDYTGPYPKPSGKYRNQEEFRTLIAYRYLARTRKSVGAKMTNCTAEILVSPLSSEQKELLKVTSMPHMVYDCPSYFRTGIDTNEETTPKIRDLLYILTDKWKDVKSILIYSRYKESQFCIRDLLDEYGIESIILNGDTSKEERESIVNCFKLGDIRILITNVQKGLNFGNCNYCIFYSYDPNPNKMVQFEGRMTRSYDIDNKHVCLLISKGKELRTFKKIVADRAKASDLFAGSDFSCVLSLLLDDGKIDNLK